MSNNKWLKHGDIIVEASCLYYHIDKSRPKGYKLDKTMLSRTVIYQDWENPEKHMRAGLKLYRQLREVYQEWPDGQVTVSITIKDEGVNV
jgi:hypothetical protein